MFTRNSRYHGLEQVTATDPSGREVTAVKLRRLPRVEGRETDIRDGDRLDIMGHRAYADGTRYWHIADANTELEAGALVEETGRDILVPER